MGNLNRIISPRHVGSLTAVPGVAQVIVTIPSYADAFGNVTRILNRLPPFPTQPNGAVIAQNQTQYTDTEVTGGVNYIYQYMVTDGRNLVSAIQTANATPSGGTGAPRKKWYPGWGMLLDGFMSVSPSLNDSFVSNILETEQWPNITTIKLMVRWGKIARGTTVNNVSFSQGLDDLARMYEACEQAGKRLLVSVHPVNFGGGNNHNGDMFPQYISENPTTYGITEPLSYGSGANARTWRASVTDELIRCEAAIADAFDHLPYFYGTQTEETSINVANGVDGFDGNLYRQQLIRQIQACHDHFPMSQIRCSTNFSNAGSVGGSVQGVENLRQIIAACHANDVGCGGPDIIPREAITANLIFNGFNGGIDYRGRSPWWSEIQLPEMGSGKEGNYTMLQHYNNVTQGIAYNSATNPPGSVFTLAGVTGYPMRPSHIIVTRNMTPASDPVGGFRLLWNVHCVPFINANPGYGPNGNIYPLDLPQ